MGASAPFIMDSIDILLNGMPLHEFVIFYLVAIGGMLMFFLHNLYTSIKTDINTPITFHWRYFWKGLIRVILSVLSLPAGIVFFGEISLMVFATETPAELNALSALLLGIGVDRLWKGLLGFGIDAGNFSKGVIKRLK